MPFTRLVRLLPILILITATQPSPARADIAPPDYPPGANPAPGSQPTQVRMLSESVLINVHSNPVQGRPGAAQVTARFTMRNLGQADERIQVRFPLTFYDNSGDGFGKYPEIQNLVVKVNEGEVSTQRVSNSYQGYGNIPWAAFHVTFPPNEDIIINVAYQATGQGEYPYVAFQYTLVTGDGWAGTIGSADLVVRLPYEASPLNVIFDTQIGWSQTSPGGVIDGREVRWHYEDFEPGWEHNLEVSLVMPGAWQKVLIEGLNVNANPGDGEAWGRLGKAYKEIFMLRRGFREDAGGLEAYRLSIEAYENCLELIPDDALWHAGFSELLFLHYYYGEKWIDQPNHSEMIRSLQELHRSLELDPDNEKALQLLDNVPYAMPEALERKDDSLIFHWLTATPSALPSPTANPGMLMPTETLFIRAAEETLIPTVLPSLTKQSSSQTAQPSLSYHASPFAAPPLTPTQPVPKNNLPMCGSSLLAPLVIALAGVIHTVRKRGI